MKIIKNQVFLLLLFAVLLLAGHVSATELPVASEDVELTANAANQPLQLAAIFRDHMVIQRDKPVGIWGRGKVGTIVTVKFAGQTRSATVLENGLWRVGLAPLTSGGPYQLTVTSSSTSGAEQQIRQDVLVGEVWLCSGQSNMVFPVTTVDPADKEAVLGNINPRLRLWTSRHASFLKPIGTMTDISENQAGWQIADPVTANQFSAVCFITGNNIANKLGVPVGLIVSALGGTPIESWISGRSLKTYSSATSLVETIENATTFTDIPKVMRACGEHATATVNFNAMIRPLVPYQIRGILWYQGESSAIRAAEYKTLLLLLISDWRGMWNQSADKLPFFYVQLPAYKFPIPSVWPELRDSQSKVSVLSEITNLNAFMNVVTDTGDPDNIHPADKKKVADRLANLVLDKTYQAIGPVQQPRFKTASVSGNSIIVTFENVGSGLVTAYPDNVPGFELAGSDMIYRRATGRRIGPYTVAVTSNVIANPKTVRYDWTEVTVASLKGENSLPVAPFRTDDIPLVTENYSLAQRPLCQQVSSTPAPSP